MKECFGNVCSRCGKVGSRLKGFFVCSHCGYSLSANLNASRNLAKHHSMPDGVSADVKQPYIPNDDSKVSFDELRMSSGMSLIQKPKCPDACIVG